MGLSLTGHGDVLWFRFLGRGRVLESAGFLQGCCGRDLWPRGGRGGGGGGGGGGKGRGEGKLGALASYLTSYPSLPSLTMA